MRPDAEFLNSAVGPFSVRLQAMALPPSAGREGTKKLGQIL